jgi:hypothetical protein
VEKWGNVLVRVHKVVKRVGESGEMVIVMVQKEFKWGKWEMASEGT